MLDLLLKSLITGLITGTLAAMFGLGGGFLLVPTLNILGVEIHHAIGTSSASIIFTALSSSYAYYKQKKIYYDIGIALASTAVIGAYIGAWLTSIISPSKLKVIFGITLIFVAYRMIKKKPAEEVKEKVRERRKWVPIGGFFSGVLSGLLGVGGGIINVPFLTWLGVPIHNAVATSSFAIIFTSTSSAIKHYLLGNVELYWLPLLVPGLIVGAQIGARIAKKTKARSLKNGFAIVMLILAIRMILKGLGYNVP
ncbi:sulfite exporter TauE/SafE family protein [Pyrococcus horikoshii]|uniref:Probable membrane transporter protein n=2 Tax=Pyrococcus horikoshii TaxID=53953 RepID=O58254_PYRHO|nr:sulfite exporter TauE/SafE family protein [Pyrococcus horikoshii]BAA29606.1 252aa long hypothetical protein [Pyrococcus horikoshii OT3]HII60911.1 sulfite exporter TauE/SafE family protein [Pyrococcus horikoshii]